MKQLMDHDLSHIESVIKPGCDADLMDFVCGGFDVPALAEGFTNGPARPRARGPNFRDLKTFIGE
jgi:hypothetical protein